MEGEPLDGPLRQNHHPDALPVVRAGAEAGRLPPERLAVVVNQVHVEGIIVVGRPADAVGPAFRNGDDRLGPLLVQNDLLRDTPLGLGVRAVVADELIVLGAKTLAVAVPGAGLEEIGPGGPLVQHGLHDAPLVGGARHACAGDPEQETDTNPLAHHIAPGSPKRQRVHRPWDSWKPEARSECIGLGSIPKDALAGASGFSDMEKPALAVPYRAGSARDRG